MRASNSLNQVYPNIQGQLHSKHSIEINAATKQFSELYKNSPQYLVISKCAVTLAQSTDVKILMGIQKGIIIGCKSNQTKSDIFINSNLCKEEIILSYKGEIKQGQSNMANMFSDIYKLAIQDISLNKTHGGVIYIHSNIPQSMLNKSKSLQLGMYAALLQINGVFESYSEQQVSTKLDSSQNFQCPTQICFKDMLSLEHNKLTVKYNSQTSIIQLPNSLKFIFFNSFSTSKVSSNTNQTIQKTEIEMNSCLMQLVQGSLLPEQLFNILYDFQKYQYNTELLQRFQAVKKLFPQTPIFLVENGEFIVLVCHRISHSQFINRLSKLVTTHKKVDTEKQQLAEIQLQKKWSNKCKTRDNLFSSFACSALHILEFREQQQFDAFF